MFSLSFLNGVLIEPELSIKKTTFAAVLTGSSGLNSFVFSTSVTSSQFSGHSGFRDEDILTDLSAPFTSLATVRL